MLPIDGWGNSYGVSGGGVSPPPPPDKSGGYAQKTPTALEVSTLNVKNVLSVKKKIMYRIFIILFLLIWTNICFGQIEQMEIFKLDWDSICQSLPKYERPQRHKIDFPFVEVSDDYKIQEMHRAIPKPSEDDYDGMYDYYFVASLLDYNPITDSVFRIGKNNIHYRLKDTYFFDINGDGKLDFIHHPLYYKRIWFDYDQHDIFIQIENGYKRLSFSGFIFDISFNENGTLNKIKTFQSECCASGYETFFYYDFDATKNELLLTKEENVWNCQFKLDN